MPSLIVDLYIPPEEYLRIYQGTARMVSARSRDGRSVQFPASIIHKYLTHDGIRGSFEIRFDENNKFAGVVKIG